MLRIKQERLRRGWTQVDLAYHSRVSVPEISRIESGRVRPYNAHVARISAALGIRPEALLDPVSEALEAQEVGAA